jgi:DNA-binding transcriptional MerR regulator
MIGSYTMSIQDAASILGVSTRTVSSYIGKGFLSTTKKRGSNRKWLDPVEVEQLRLTLSENGKVVSRAEYLRMKAQVRRLEHQMETVLRILDTKSDPLRMSPDYAKGLYEAAASQLSAGIWVLEDIEKWNEVFMRVDEDDLFALSTAAGDSKPWKLLLRLCVAMTAFVLGRENYSTSLELQSTHKLLVEGRRRLRISAMCYMDIYSTDMDKDLRRYAMADSPSSVADRLKDALRR